jgi:aspartate/methionine/tyrosine aminotransferase
MIFGIIVVILVLSNANLISSKGPERPTWKEYEMSLHSQLIHNPVWANAEAKVPAKNPHLHLEPIFLNLPSVEGLKPNEMAIEALEKVVAKSKHQEFNKYAPSIGLPAAREAIVKVEI